MIRAGAAAAVVGVLLSAGWRARRANALLRSSAAGYVATVRTLQGRPLPPPPAPGRVLWPWLLIAALLVVAAALGLAAWLAVYLHREGADPVLALVPPALIGYVAGGLLVPLLVVAWDDWRDRRRG